MKGIILAILFLIITVFGSVAQISSKHKPSFFEDVKREIPIVLLPEIKTQNLERKENRKDTRLKALRFAQMIPVDIKPDTHGFWEYLEEKRIWYVSIKSKDAYSLSLVFDHYRIPVGSKLFVYSVDQKHVRGAFTHKNNKLNYHLPIAPVKGDEIIIEYHEPYDVDFKGELHISEIAHDYKDVFQYLSKQEKSVGKSGECNVNINCDDDELWQLLKHSVCKITVGGFLCSGALINNTNQDGRPYFLTANHCINDPSDVSNAVFYFNYESPDCTTSVGSTDQTISGSSLIANPPEKTIDFSLLELSVAPPPEYKPYYAGWSRDIKDPLTATTIHHPQGDVKKITKSYDGATTGDFGEGYDQNKHWWVKDWEEGTTEGGSSGSPLFDQEGRIIGDLTGGDASCGYNYNDYYQQLYHSWQDFENPAYQLKPWLDPMESGVVSLDGYLPYKTIPSQLKASRVNTTVDLSWNHVEDTAAISFYYVYKDSVIIDSVKYSNYTDILASKGGLHQYFITAKYKSPDALESLPSNTIYVYAIDPVGLPFAETFGDSMPSHWYENKLNDTVGWQFKAGGYDGLLDNAFEGAYNAYFFADSGNSAKLVAPIFDFSTYTNLKLSFYLHMPKNNEAVDKLNVLYKEEGSLNWKIIRTFNTNVESWQKMVVPLPMLSDDYRIALDGVALGGFGIAIDSLAIVEDDNFIVPEIFTDKDTICIYDSIAFSTDLDETYQLDWDFGVNAYPQFASGNGPHWVQYLTPGLKPVQLTANNTYRTEICDVAVVYEIPDTPSFINNGDTLISSSETGNQWYYNDLPIQNANQKTYIIQVDGFYFVEVTNALNCTSISATQQVLKTSNYEVVNNTNNERVTIYPNPNNGSFKVKIAGLSGGHYYYKIISLNGTELQSGFLESYKEIQDIQLENPKNGIYFIQIYSDTNYYSSKFLIKK